MQERELKLLSGWTALFVSMASLALLVWMFIVAVSSDQYASANGYLLSRAAVPYILFALFIWFVMQFGFIVNGPNQSRVIQLFGAYVGTIRDTGFFYGNPFYSRTRVSLKARTFETGLTSTEEVKDPTSGKVLVPATHARKPSKVNDRDGTPIEIAAIVVWKVISPTDAVFQVDNYEEFVKLQSESALRNLASQYRYDGQGDERSLRGNTAMIGEELKRELHERFQQAGVEVLEARISYLAYAPEIAAAMLQRQQASAMIAARQQIVEAAVSMVEHALVELSKRQVVELDVERKAAMVSNLMVVLCGHGSPQPVVNTGTLYH
jgi:regulator of protease activity HflC (stomatin/prohibitin superfamily)